MEHVGQRILQRRMELEMSQEELAEKVGYKDRSSIAKIESGKRDIRQKKVIAFAQALKTTPQWLMGYDDEGTKKDRHETAPVIKELSYDDIMKVMTENEWILTLKKMSPENRKFLESMAERLLLSQDLADLKEK